MKSLYGFFRLVNVVDKKYPFNTEDIIAIKALTETEVLLSNKQLSIKTIAIEYNR